MRGHSREGSIQRKKHDHASYAATTRLNSVRFIAPQTKSSNWYRPLMLKLFSKTSVSPMRPVRASAFPALSAENDPECRWQTGEAAWQTKSTAWKGRRNLSQSDVGHPKKQSGSAGFSSRPWPGVAGAAGFGATSFSRTSASAQQAELDVAILEFALNLEYPEAEFYLRAAYGYGLSSSLLGPDPGPVTGGQSVHFSSQLVAAYAREIADEERKHVEFLRAALTAATGSAISSPAIDFTKASRSSAARPDLGRISTPSTMTWISSGLATSSRTSA